MAGELLVPRPGLNLATCIGRGSLTLTDQRSPEVLPEEGVGPAARPSKANNQARLVKRKVCLFQMPATGWRGGQTSVQKANSLPYTENQWGIAIDRRMGLPVETVQSPLTVIFKQVTGV